jgi:hypothetical protein
MTFSRDILLLYCKMFLVVRPRKSRLPRHTVFRDVILSFTVCARVRAERKLVYQVLPCKMIRKAMDLGHGQHILYRHGNSCDSRYIK